MAAASYSNSQLVEIIRNSLARSLALGRVGDYGEAADRMLAEGVDLDAALRHLLIYRRQQGLAEAVPVLRARALAILRAALGPTGPFVTLPKLGKAFHIRYRSDISDTDYGIEIITDNGISPGRDVIMRLRPTEHEGGRPAVPQELIDELDREACATLTAARKPLRKEARATLIQSALITQGYHLAPGTIKNRLRAKRP